MSLRQYALEVLQEHCRLPSLEQWLDGLSRLPVSLAAPAVEAVREARESGEAALLDAVSSP